MKPAELIVNRPVGVSLLALALMLCGALAWRMLPVSPLPEMDIPVIVVSANLPGASPESMASTVATPMERALGSIPGVVKLGSSSRQGSTKVWLIFELNRDLNEAAREVQAAINTVRHELPAGMPSNPQYSKLNPSQAPIMALALSSPNLSPSELYDTGASILAQKLAQITGVGEVSIDGASLPAVRVQLQPGALVHYGISLDEVRNSIDHSNAQLPLGAIENGQQRWQVQITNPMRSATDFRKLVIHYENGAAVRLEDIANVSDSVENRLTSGFHNDLPAVILMISRQTDANIVEIIDAIHELLPQFRELIPANAELTVVMDRSLVIRATLSEAHTSLLLAVLMVILVIWVFLGKVRSALIPSAAMPVSLIGSFVVMYFFGFSLNSLSLMALIVATGLVVDDTIVVLENVERHLHNGLSPRAAAVKSVREVGLTLAAMTLALAAVFISLLLAGGLTAQLFREFSVTLVGALLISLLVSLTLTPALCALWLKDRAPSCVPSLSLVSPGITDQYSDPENSYHSSRSQAAGGNHFSRLGDHYATSLEWLLRYRLWGLVLLFLAIVLSVKLFANLPMEPLPTQDTGQISGFVKGDDGFSFQIMQPKIEEFRRYILQDPAVEDLTGTSGGRSLSNAMLTIKLKPLSERKASAQEVVDRLRANTPKIPGAVLHLMVEQDLPMLGGGGGGFGRNEEELVLRSDDLGALKSWSSNVAQAMKQIPLIVDVESTGDDAARQVTLQINREAARQLGVDMQTIASFLNNSFSQRQITTLYEELNQYRVVMELTPEYTQRPDALSELEVLTDDGSRVPLSTFATWNYGMAEDRVDHEDQFASVSIGYGLAPGVTSVEAEAAIDQLLREMVLPISVHKAPPTPNDFAAVLENPAIFLWVLLTVYLVLGILYESTLHPLTIFSTLPPAGLGALLALKTSGQNLSLIVLLGLCLLIGIVMKNAILMIDFALQAQHQQGLSPSAAIQQAARLRLRPILMTNMAGMLGAVPLIIGFGEGAEMRQPLGTTIFGGLALSQLMTLYTTPVIYLYLEQLRQRMLRGKLNSQLASRS